MCLAPPTSFASPEVYGVRGSHPSARSSATMPFQMKRGEVSLAPLSLDCRFERLDQVSALPREAAVGFGGAAEVAVGRGTRINRAVKAKMRADAAGRQVHHLCDGALNLGGVHIARAEGVSIDRERLGNANRVRELNRATLG